MSKQFADRVSKILELPIDGVSAVAKLFEKDATIPFIARYRKEATGGLDEVQVEKIKNELDRFQELDKRKKTIVKVLKESGAYTDALQVSIDQIWISSELEDFYLPFKPKKTTKASVARAKGLEPLAKIIMAQNELNLNGKAQQFAQGISLEEALEGARHIIAEWISENKRARNLVRYEFQKGALIISKLIKGKKESGAKFSDYFELKDRLQKCPSHRLMAMLRGEKEGVLRLKIEPLNEETIHKLEDFYIKGSYDVSDHVRLAVQDAYKRLLLPSLESEFKKHFKEKAELDSIEIFKKNLHQLLMAPPLGEEAVLAIDPGFRTGCKSVVLNAKGNLMVKKTFFFHTSGKNFDQKGEFKSLIEKFEVKSIAIGDGTASRETEAVVKEIVGDKIQIYVISEAGASIYSGSEVAREEFPNEDITVRGAISIGRRLQDPLSELVKIDPKSIGVGQYQYDVNQKLLKSSLTQVVESTVNQVGVNVNTASKYLLTYVSGLGEKVAENIVYHRRKKGKFKTRKDLLNIPGLGAKAFELSAGFLRIKNGPYPLDDSAVHPESYKIVEAIAKDNAVSVSGIIGNQSVISQIDLNKYVTSNTGMYTLKDIIKELAKPGIDPRGQAEQFEFDQNVRKMEDLKVGMKLPGIVTNITKFGAFVDIGVKQDGLVHISQLADKYVSDPMDVIKLRDHVFVKVIDVDFARKRVNLSIKQATN